MRLCGKILYSRADHSMRIAYWIPKSTDTQSECVIRITFPPQKLLHERASVLHYIYRACFVNVQPDCT